MIKIHRSAEFFAPARCRSVLRSAAVGAPTAAVVMLVAVTSACSSPHPAEPAGDMSSPAGQSAAAAATPAATTPSAAGGAAAPITSGSARATTPAASKKDVIAGLIAFNGKLSFSGAHHLSTPFIAFPGVVSPKSSCADLAAVGTPVAKGRHRQFQIPSPPEGDDATITAEISPYHGPGTYQKESVVTVGPSVVVANASYNLRAAGATVTVTLRANGSGQLTFNGATGGQSGQPALSGTVQWSCVVK